MEIEYWLIWLIMAVVMLIVEVATLTMWSLCMAVGCLASMICALCGAGVAVQLVALPVGGVIAYLLLMPLFRRKRTFVPKSDENSRTGMDALLGRRAVVTKEIRPGELGRARIDGDNWQVRAPGVAETVPRGAEVSVTSYESIILDVRPLPIKNVDAGVADVPQVRTCITLRWRNIY